MPPVQDKPGQPPRERASERHGAPRGSSLIRTGPRRPRTRVRTPLPREGSAHAAGSCPTAAGGAGEEEGTTKKGRKTAPRPAAGSPAGERLSASAPLPPAATAGPAAPPPRSHLPLLPLPPLPPPPPAPLAPHQTFSPLSPCFLAPRVTRAGADWRSRRRKAWRRGGGAGPAAN